VIILFFINFDKGKEDGEPVAIMMFLLLQSEVPSAFATAT
jgi:hypothetical protein